MPVVCMCKNCEVKFSVIPSRKNAKYCSFRCMSIYRKSHKEEHPAWKGGDVTKKCIICGNNFQSKRSNFRKICSTVCNSEFHKITLKKFRMENAEKIRIAFTGENNPNWRGGIMTVNDKIRKSGEYEKWRNSVYRRDRWICRFCGTGGRQIIAHHIMSFATYPNTRFYLKNGITLCRSCHMLVHRKRVSSNLFV